MESEALNIIRRVDPEYAQHADEAETGVTRCHN